MANVYKQFSDVRIRIRIQGFFSWIRIQTSKRRIQIRIQEKKGWIQIRILIRIQTFACQSQLY